MGSPRVTPAPGSSRSLPRLPSERAQAAWEELYAAEGSDWFWWYGDDFDTDYKAGIRPALSHPPPQRLDACGSDAARSVESADLSVPAASPEADLRDQRRSPCYTPPSMDIVTDFFEWRGAGTIKTQPPLGAMWKAEGLFTAIQFGWSLDQLVSPARSGRNDRRRGRQG